MTQAAQPLPCRPPQTPAHAAAEPFASAAEAWFWTMAAFANRRAGRKTAGSGAVVRPCRPDDVVKCLDSLYRRRRIDLEHARILRIWGERQVAPQPGRFGPNGDWRLWTEALNRLEWKLRMKKIVV